MNPEQVDGTKAPTSLPNKRFVNNKKLLVVGVCLAVIAFAITGRTLQARHSKHFKGTAECIALARKNEGNLMAGVYSLECTLSPRKLANSSLSAQYLAYSGSPRDSSVCDIDSIEFPAPPDYKYCIANSGIVTGDGKFYQGVGVNNGTPTIPLDYDYCYSARPFLPSQPKPTTHDLYYYQGAVYDRDVYNNVDLKTPYGTCMLNGTMVYHPGFDNGKYVSPVYITNVKVDYRGFPKDCLTITLGRAADDFLQCSEIVTAANASLDACYDNHSLIVTKGKITGFKTEFQLYVGQYRNGSCEEVYVQRMAALNRCNDIVSAKLRTACEPKVSQPSEDVKRVSTQI